MASATTQRFTAARQVAGRAFAALTVLSVLLILATPMASASGHGEIRVSVTIPERTSTLMATLREQPESGRICTADLQPEQRSVYVVDNDRTRQVRPCDQHAPRQLTAGRHQLIVVPI